MKVAFYLPNKFCYADCSNVDLGNPGIGGTEYMIIALAYHLSICQKKHEILIFAQHDTQLPQHCSIVKVEDVIEALYACKQKNVECLIVQNSQETNKLFNEDLGGLKLVMWAHSFMSRMQWNLYARSANVKRIVCVGNEELELYCDHKAFKKSTVIFNAFPLPSSTPFTIPFQERENEVTFLASIVPHTHFHLLAKVWKEVIRQVPDAHLNVIGSGNLYNNSKALGKYQIAQNEYENYFMPHLLDEKGNILQSVTFWGKLGNEKYEILKRTKVGIANPGGYETFCISAVEMQLYGAKVVSCKKGRLLDTVFDERNLFVSEKELINCIVNALKCKQHNYEEVFLFLQKRFSFNIVCREWEKLLVEVENNIPQRTLPPNSKAPTALHHLRHFNRTLKNITPFGFYWMPCMKFYESAYHRIKQLF